MAVRQVAAVREVHAEDRVARLEHRHVDGHVGLRARVRLHVDVLGAEQLLRAIDRQRFGDVHELAAAVVPLARIALGVLVRHHGAGGLEHGEADEVLGRDELEAFFLAADFVADGGGDLGIDGGESDVIRACGIVGVERRAILSTRCWCRPPRKRRVEKDLDEAARLVRRRQPFAEREHVRVVVLAAEPRGRLRRRPARRGCPAPCWRQSPCRCRSRRTRRPRSNAPAATARATGSAKSG